MVGYERTKTRHDYAIMPEHQIFNMLDYRYHYAKLITSPHFSKPVALEKSIPDAQSLSLVIIICMMDCGVEFYHVKVFRKVVELPQASVTVIITSCLRPRVKREGSIVNVAVAVFPSSSNSANLPSIEPR